MFSHSKHPSQPCHLQKTVWTLRVADPPSYRFSGQRFWPDYVVWSPVTWADETRVATKVAGSNLAGL